MIEERALVVAVHGDEAEIATQRQSACGACSAKGGCGTALLGNWFPRRRLTFRVRNVIGAAPGDQVMIGLDAARLQSASLWLYALPLAGLLGGAIAGERAFAHLGWSQELGSVSAGLLGLIAALMWVRQRTAANPGDQSGLRLLRVVHRTASISPHAFATSVAQQTQESRNTR